MIDRNVVKILGAMELADANQKYPLFHSNHEAFSVLSEEVEEVRDCLLDIEQKLYCMWDNVRHDDNATFDMNRELLAVAAEQLIQEAVQVYAMAIKGFDEERY